MDLRSPPPPRHPAHPRLGWVLGVALLLGLLAGAPSGAQADPAPLAQAVLRLSSPLAAEREAALVEIAKGGAAGAVICRRLMGSALPSERRQGWRIATLTPSWVDPAQARASLGDPDLQVGVQAAAALVAHAQVSAGKAVLLPRGSLSVRGTRALQVALAAALETAPADRIPAIGLAFGEGALPALAAIAKAPRFHRRVRGLATAVIGRMGGSAAGGVLVGLVDPEVTRERTDLLRALLDVPLSEAQRTVIYRELRSKSVSLRRRHAHWLAYFLPRGFGWRERPLRRALVRVHPPTENLEGLKAFYLWRLGRPRGRGPTDAVAYVQGLAAIDGIGEEELRLVLDTCVDAPSRRRWRGGSDDLGSIMVLLDGLGKHRASVQAGIRSLFERRAAPDLAREAPASGLEEEPVPPWDPGPLEGEGGPQWQTTLPRTVEAWGHFILGCPEPRLVAMATALIDGDGEEVPNRASRHLGVRLWNRIGPPPVALIRRLLGDGDAWIRRSALRWIPLLPAAERRSVRERALADAEDSVFLGVGNQAPGLEAPVHLRRLLRLGVMGTRVERKLAWGLLEAVPALSGPPAGGASGSPEPWADRPLDQRLEAAAGVRRRFGLDQVLPRGEGR